MQIANPKDSPDYVGGRFEPYHFTDAAAAAEYEEFDIYVELRVDGTPADLALIEAFDMIRIGKDLSNVQQLALAIETNTYVRRKFKEVLATKDIKRDLWTQNESVNQRLRMIKDPRTRDSVRLNAILQLDIMCDYIKLDEVTTRRVDKTISEFKRQHAAWMEAGSPQRQDPQQPPAAGGSVH